MGVRIENIVAADFNELIALIREFASFERLPEKMTNSAEKMNEDRDFFHGFAAKDQDNRIVGYVTFFFAYYTWTGKSLYMDDLYVRPEYRGKGIGSELIGSVIRFAQKERCRLLRWQVADWNTPAIAFYKKLGAEINRVDMNCDLSLSLPGEG